jgi:hypothetical protein
MSTATAFEAVVSAWDEQVCCEMTTQQGTRCRRPAYWRADLHGCEQALLCGQHKGRMGTSSNATLSTRRGCALLVVSEAVRQLRRRVQGDAAMSSSSAALRLVPDIGAGDDDGGLSPIEQWELYMRGAGRSQRTISETIGVLRQLEKFSGTRVESIRPLDIARFLGRRRLKQNSRAAYFGYIHSFYRWWGENGGANTTAKLPRPKAP